MTQHGSFPGRPRGRRARHDNNVPQWQGYDATPAEQREFPDLAPIRPQEARARDGRAQDDWQWGQEQAQGQPGQDGWQQGDPSLGYRQDYAQGYPQAPQGPQAPQPQRPQEAPQPPEPATGQQEEDIPDWAEPDSLDAFSARWHRRGLDSRDDRRADRRKHRRMLFAGGGVAAVAIAVVVYFLIGGGGSSATPGFGALITSFLPGELQSVPDACDTVPAAMLSEYLPGTLKKAAPPLNTGANTQCTWTLDSPPRYRVLDVQIVAYAPSALYGNGSATAVAELTYSSDHDNFRHPGAKSGQPAAHVTDLSGMPGGNDTSAFVATQVFHRNGAVSDMATVVVRYRNVLVTVMADGLDQANGKKKYGPVSMGELTTAAKTVAEHVTGAVVK